MTTKMLIDAAHPEETRVVVTRGNRVEEFDFESANRRPLRGNIYLAKVTRVEPSLQAAFVDYGGNRHGFLAFGEIHPDYYQIPVADRQRLLEQAAAEAEEDAARALAEGDAAAEQAGGGEAESEPETPETDLWMPPDEPARIDSDTVSADPDAIPAEGVPPPAGAAPEPADED
ncbi:MAG: ribonuclease E/G, partial [Rhabdaerophilum calidifontis]